ncbi:hypothetical protein [Brachybacterium sacelli]|uniref:Multidrug transporter n=1 Tax=Brachybacterium sacelli TaxID=173364 RepID=A0ABS4X0Y3_9MICO|nr:hypothetical protein [Brachybacterium sacelli]MBP2382109.1 hypothetical protein [Brachybacterium sacelli]
MAKKRRRDMLRPGGLSSIPELFPGEKEKVEGLEIAQEAQAESQVEPRAEPSFLDGGPITLRLRPDGSDREGDADHDDSASEETAHGRDEPEKS